MRRLSLGARAPQRSAGGLRFEGGKNAPRGPAFEAQKRPGYAPLRPVAEAKSLLRGPLVLVPSDDPPAGDGGGGRARPHDALLSARVRPEIPHTEDQLGDELKFHLGRRNQANFPQRFPGREPDPAGAGRVREGAQELRGIPARSGARTRPGTKLSERA